MTATEFEDLRWQVQPIGVPFPIQTHLTGVTTPPTDNPNYRYIKLTASDSYNTGVLTSESVSGSAPLVQATAVINDAVSSLNGQTVRLINTERRVIRAGNSGTLEADALQNIVGSMLRIWTSNNPTEGGSGVFEGSNGGSNTRGSVAGTHTQNVSFDASRVARTSDETRPKNIGADYFMRIR